MMRTIGRTSACVVAVLLGVVLAPRAALAASTLALSYPSAGSTETCGGFTTPLGVGGGGVCFQSGDELTETFTAVVPAGTFFTRSRWQFTMDDLTGAGSVNTFDVQVNGVVVGSFTSIGNGGNPDSLRTFDLRFEHAPIQGPDVTLRIVATSTVPMGLSSWNWFPGGTVTFVPVTDEFACYGSKDLKAPKFTPLAGIALEDDLGTNAASLKKPSLVCLPTSRNASGTQQSLGICCYATKAAKLPAKVNLSTEDTFGSLSVQVKKPSLLCVPCRAATS